VVYRSDIDGLRALAVAGVIAFHTFPNWLPGGFVGVDIFFVISGYLITGIICDELRSGTFTLAGFYERRIRRIFPALIVVLAATLAASWNILPANQLASLGKNAVAGALFSANLMLLSEVGYFDIAAHAKPLLHLWSLGIEEQFYLAWPLVLLALPRQRIRLAIVIGIAVSFALNLALIETWPAATFYLPFTRAFELLAGACMVVAPKLPRLAREPLGLAGAVAVDCALLLFNDKMPFPGTAALLPVCGTVLLIWSEGSLVSRILAFRPFVAIGLISYPLYLWHWPILCLLRIQLSRALTVDEASAAIVVTILLAILTYFTIERPVRRRRLAWPLVTAMAGVAGLAAFPARGYAPALPGPVEAYNRLINDGTGWRVNECMLLDGDRGDFSTCTDAMRPLIAVWGDSTAAALMPGFHKAQPAGGFGIAQLTVSSCPPLLVQAHSMDAYCLEKNAEIAKLIAAQQPDMVLLHSIWDVNDKLATTRPTVDALRAAGVRHIAILGPVPVWPGGLPSAAVNFYRDTHSLIPERTWQVVDQVSGDQTMREIAAALHVDYISARDVFCNKDGCLTRIDDRPVASDLLHLTPAGSAFLVSAILPKLAIGRSGTQSELSATKPTTIR